MSKKYRIEYLPVAQRDLVEVFEYIKNDSPTNARSFIENMDKTIFKLEDFPFMGVVPKDVRLQRLGYRMLVIEKCLIFYVVIDEAIVEIRRILHGKRKYDFLTTQE